MKSEEFSNYSIVMSSKFNFLSFFCPFFKVFGPNAARHPPGPPRSLQDLPRPHLDINFDRFFMIFQSIFNHCSIDFSPDSASTSTHQPNYHNNAATDFSSALLHYAVLCFIVLCCRFPFLRFALHDFPIPRVRHGGGCCEAPRYLHRSA